MAVPINNVPRRVVFAASGTGPYSFTFEILAAGDIAVFDDDDLLTLTTDYTVTINLDGTGSVTLAAPPSGTQIAIVGNRTIQRISDFVTGGDFFANTLNDELDQQTIFNQQNAEGLSRALQAPQTDPTNIDMTLPRAADRAGKYLAFDVNGNPEPGDTAVEVAGVFAIRDDITTVAGISGNVTTVAGISGNVTTVAGVSGNVTTVAGISSNVTTVATNNSNVTAVAGNATNINTVAGIAANVTTVATNNANVTKVAVIDTDVTTVAGIDSDVSTVAGIAADVTAVAAIDTDVTAVVANAADITTVAGVATEVAALGPIAGDITTVAGIDADVTAVAGDAANIGTVASISTDVSSVAGIAADVVAVAGNATDISAVAGDLTNVGTVAGIAADVTAVAAIDSDITAVAAIGSDVTTVAANVTDITNFAEVYLGPHASDPTTRNDSSPLQAGDLYFNTAADVMKVYDGAAWVAAYVSGDGFLPLTGGTMSGAITFAAGQALDGGTINNTTIGATTASTGAFTTLSASTSVTTPSVTNAGTLALSATGANVATISTNGSERLRVESGGNVGIGTNSVSSIGSGYQTVQLSGTNGSGVRFYRGATSNTALYGDSNGFYLQVAEDLPMFFWTNNTERARIPAAGGIQSVGSISVGNATPTTSGAGITFPATQSASTDANTLDDYEEGTFTATLKGGTTDPTTPVTTTGTYTKIGRLVFARVFFNNINNTGASGFVQVDGLPFAASTQTMTSSVYQDRFDMQSGLSLNGNIQSTTVYIDCARDDNVSQSLLHTAGTGRWLRFSVTYEV